MERLTTACAVFLCCASLPAQGSMTTPPGGLTGEGAVYSYLIGIWPDMRIQLIDDMHSDGKARAITDIAFRLDNRGHTSTTAMGRTWSNITVAVSELKSQASTSFASNLGTSSTRVFDSKWSWPTQVGFPLLRPDVWGGVKGQLRFPFLKPWVYTAKGSIVSDYTFRGGVLASNGAWSATTASPFLLDGELVLLTLAPAGVEQIPAPPPRCSDSALRFANGAFAYGTASAYSKSHSSYLGGTLQFSHSSSYTAPNAPVVYAMGMAGIPTGLNIGAGCNRLYVDFSRPVILRSHMTSTTGSFLSDPWTLGWRDGFASLDLWLQAAWLDSSTKAFKLTGATHLSFPRALPPDEPLRFWSVYHTNNTSAVGSGPSNVSYPFIRYSLQ